MNGHCVETFPPAKLNLFLELKAKRPDGFHELETVMVAIDRYDRLRVSLVPAERSSVTLQCQWSPAASVWQQRHLAALNQHDSASGAARSAAEQENATCAADLVAEIPSDERNLVVRGLALFRETYGIEAGFLAILQKQIPAGAGMGGASSDVASALLAAAKLCQVPTNDPQLLRIAAELGSDVPFFLGCQDEPIAHSAIGFHRAALATGRGECLRPLNVNGNWPFVVVYPPQAVSTVAVYAGSRIADQPITSTPLAEAFSGGNRERLIAGMVNRLTEPARKISAWIDRTLESMQHVGLSGVSMTGSGSACFGIARSAADARRAVNRLSSRRLGICFVANPTRLPAPVRYVA
ncbi:4-(cytidine 5'-diphospho)-2-C-methyl-D-erythritol kinase [Planctomycetaceae bacterium SH139]